MVISFAQILQESVEKLLPSGKHTTAELPHLAVFAMVSTILIKGIIWFGCIRIKTTQVQALAQGNDHHSHVSSLNLTFQIVKLM
jgi:hypothetical protein